MVTALVDSLGAKAPTGGHTFPTPAAVATAPETFFRDVARAGYRGPYIRTLATDVAEGRLDLEELNDRALPDEEVEQRLLALPGVGPYAAAHVMLMSLGRYSQLSSTRGRGRRTRSSRDAKRATRRSSAASTATATSPASRSGCS